MSIEKVMIIALGVQTAINICFIARIRHVEEKLSKMRRQNWHTNRYQNQNQNQYQNQYRRPYQYRQ